MERGGSRGQTLGGKKQESGHQLEREGKRESFERSTTSKLGHPMLLGRFGLCTGGHCGNLGSKGGARKVNASQRTGREICVCIKRVEKNRDTRKKMP